MWQGTVDTSAYTPNLIRIRLLYHLPGKKNRKFGLMLIFGFWGLLYPVPVTDKTEFGMPTEPTVYA